MSSLTPTYNGRKRRLFSCVLLYTLCLTILVEKASAKSLEGRLNSVLHEDLSTVHVQLVGATDKMESLVRSDGTFQFPNLKVGTYSLSIHSSRFVYPLYLVDVGERAVRAKYHTLNHGNVSGIVEHPLRVQPIAPFAAFEATTGFNIMGYLKSPFILMGIATFAILGCSKAMMSLDPEGMKEMQQQQLEKHALATVLMPSKKKAAQGKIQHK